MNKIKSR